MARELDLMTEALQASKNLDIERQDRFEAEYNKIVNEFVMQRNCIMNNVWLRQDIQEEKSRLMESARNHNLSATLKGIFMTALEAEGLTDEGCTLAESLVDKYIEEAGGATAIMLRNRNKTYLLNRIAEIVEEASVKDYNNTYNVLYTEGDLVDELEDVKQNVAAISGDDEEEGVQEAEIKIADVDSDAPKEDDKKEEKSEDKKEDSKEEEKKPEEDKSEDKKEDESKDEEKSDDDKTSDDDEDDMDDVLGEPIDKDEDGKVDEDEAKEEESEDDSSDDEDEDIEDVDDEDEEEEVEDDEDREKLYADLDKEDDVRKAIQTIKDRVADAEEKFIKNNAQDKKKMNDLIDKISQNVKAVEDLNKQDGKDKEKAIANENVKNYDIQRKTLHESRPLTVFEKIAREVHKSILKAPEAIKEQYMIDESEDNTVSSTMVVEAARVIYGFLETLNTIQLENVNPEYIQNFIENM